MVKGGGDEERDIGRLREKERIRICRRRMKRRRHERGWSRGREKNDVVFEKSGDDDDGDRVFSGGGDEDEFLVT